MASSYPERQIESYAVKVGSLQENPITITWLTPYFDVEKKKRCGPRHHYDKWNWFKWRNYFVSNHPELAIGKSDEFWRTYANEMFSACHRLYRAVEKDPSLKRFDMHPSSMTKDLSVCGKCGIGTNHRDRSSLLKYCLCGKDDRKDMNRIMDDVPCIKSICGRWVSVSFWQLGNNTPDVVVGVGCDDSYNIGNIGKFICM